MSESDYSAGEHPRFPFVPTSLLLGAVALAECSGIETVFVLTEPRLAAHFVKLGVEVRQIGQSVEHRGRRIPSVMHVEEIIRNMRAILHPLWHVVRQDIARGLEAARSGEPGQTRQMQHSPRRKEAHEMNAATGDDR